MKKSLLDKLRKHKEEELSLNKIREKYSQGKNNSSEKYFIVYANQPKGGLFVYLIGIMAQIAYANQRGYIPIVDLLNFPSNLRNTKSENAWELYFEQPSGVGVPEVYGASNLIFHGDEEENTLYIGDVEEGALYDKYQVVIDEMKEFKNWYQDEALMKKFRKFWKQNIRYNAFVREYINKKFQELIGEDENVLGLLCRGTDYISLRPAGHYVQPSLAQILEKTNEVVLAYGCKKIFLATEDAGILKGLKKNLGDKLVYMDVERVDYYDGYQLSDLYEKQKIDLFQRQLDYLTEMEILARLPYLIAGKTTGSRFIPVMKEDNFKFVYFWELGRY